MGSLSINSRVSLLLLSLMWMPTTMTASMVKNALEEIETFRAARFSHGDVPNPLRMNRRDKEDDEISSFELDDESGNVFKNRNRWNDKDSQVFEKSGTGLMKANEMPGISDMKEKWDIHIYDYSDYRNLKKRSIRNGDDRIAYLHEINIRSKKKRYLEEKETVDAFLYPQVQNNELPISELGYTNLGNKRATNNKEEKKKRGLKSLKKKINRGKGLPRLEGKSKEKSSKANAHGKVGGRSRPKRNPWINIPGLSQQEGKDQGLTGILNPIFGSLTGKNNKAKNSQSSSTPKPGVPK